MVLLQGASEVNNVNLLFAGFITDDELFNKLAKKDSNPQYAAQNYQNNLVKVLRRGEWKSFSVLGSAPRIQKTK